MRKILPGVFLILGIVALAVWGFRRSALPAAANPTDRPPSPHSLTAADERQSAWYVRDARRALELHANSTNAASRKLRAEIEELASQVTVAESNAWRNDPMLLTCDRYIEHAHDWVTRVHAAELGASTAFFFSTNQLDAGRRRQIEGQISDLLQLVLLKELSDDSNFAPILRASFDVMADMAKRYPASAGARGYEYWRMDKAIGYHDPNVPPTDTSYAAVTGQLNRRYNLALDRLARLQRDESVPGEVIAGTKYSSLYRTLDGAAEIYLECRTPPELQKLRDDLRRKIIEISWLDRPPA